MVLGEQITETHGHGRVEGIAEAFAASLKKEDTAKDLDFDLIASASSANSPLIEGSARHLAGLYSKWVATNPKILRVEKNTTKMPWEAVSVADAREEIQTMLRSPEWADDATEIRNWTPSRNDHRFRKHHIVRIMGRVKQELGEYNTGGLATETIADIDALLEVVSNNLNGTYGLNTNYGESQMSGREWLEMIGRKLLWIRQNGEKK